MIATVLNLECMSAANQTNLLYLRGQRNALAVEVISNLTWHMDDERATEFVDRMMTYRDEGSAFAKAKQSFVDHERYGGIDQLKKFRAICLRIARLEREACHQPIEGGLATA